MANDTKADRTAEAVTPEDVQRRTRTLLGIENEAAWAEALTRHRSHLIEALRAELEDRTDGPLHPDVSIDYDHPSDAEIDAAEDRWHAWQRTIKDWATAQVDNAIATCRANAESF